MFSSLHALCQQYEANFFQISEERKQTLQQLSDYIDNKLEAGLTPQIIVICTHNSRRSHLGQIWLSLAASYYQIPRIQTFSGGTEATAFNPRAVTAMNSIGFDITTSATEGNNPKYAVKWSENMLPYTAFSKKYTHRLNPQNYFAAIMVCDEADTACPIVSGNDFRLALPYDDPKVFDGTVLESKKYEERCHQIGMEMMYVMASR